MLDTLGKYKILEPAGQGGLGDLYRARDTSLGRTVALRVIGAAVAADSARREQLVRDAKLSACLSHPNIAAVYEVGEADGQLFLALEFVQGETLGQAVGGRPMNPKRAVDCAAQLADALADAHAAGMVHRHLGPDTVVITPKGNAKILDFGLPAWTSSPATPPHTARRAYTAPEQTSGHDVDHRADIYALGALLVEMLTGKPPAARTHGSDGSSVLPSALRSSVPAELETIAGRMLAPSPEHRYESAAALAAELRAVAAILDVRETTEPAPATAAARPASLIGWAIVAVIVGAIGALVYLATRVG